MKTHTLEPKTPDWIATGFERHGLLWAQVVRAMDRLGRARGSKVGLAHDALHVRRVYRWALLLAEEASADPDLCGAAALVHDVVDVPKESKDRVQGGAMSAAVGRDLLVRAGYRTSEVETVTEAVRTSSWSRGLPPGGPVGMVLQDADRLDAIGAIGIARNFACAQEMAGRGVDGMFYHAEDPLGVARGQDNSLDDTRFALDHFRCKLLKLTGSMHTNGGRVEAERRHRFLEMFLEEMGEELGMERGDADE